MCIFVPCVFYVYQSLPPIEALHITVGDDVKLLQIGAVLHCVATLGKFPLYFSLNLVGITDFHLMKEVSTLLKDDDDMDRKITRADFLEMLCIVNGSYLNTGLEF